MPFRAQDLSFHIISLGCFKNQTDSELINGALRGAGFVVAENEAGADIVIINTCGFIEDAKRESLQEIFDIEKDTSEQSSPAFRRRLVVCGCLSQRYFDQMKSEMPEIDLLYGLVDENLLATIVRNFDIEIKPSPRAVRTPLIQLPYEYIKIAEGCSNNCSFCAIPLIRGPRRSFSPDDILSDAAAAIGRGASELILIAQDSASYEYGGTALAGLLYRIAELKPQMVRVMYMHPDRIVSPLLKAMADLECVAPYLDIPFQHADHSILKSMNRSGSAERYLDLIAEIRATVPRISLRSTFMVGFPGEDARAFAVLCKFVSDARLDRAGFFMYSREEGTPAFSLGDTAPKTKVVRYNEISQLQEDITRGMLGARIGERVRVIVEEKSSDDQWIGRSEYDAPDIDGIFFLTGQGELLHKIVMATISDTAEFDLIGEL